jgi:hypothetical protein
MVITTTTATPFMVIIILFERRYVMDFSKKIENTNLIGIYRCHAFNFKFSPSRKPTACKGTSGW